MLTIIDMEQLNPADPDFFIEEFWYTFKQSMINFYYNVKINYSHIKEWSDKLNKLKSEKKYNEIENEIRSIMSLYAFDLINFCNSIYYEDLLLTNIKRWNKISKAFNFVESPEYCKIVQIFMIYRIIKEQDNSKKILDKLPQANYLINLNLFDEIIIYALDNNKSKILELLKDIPNYNLFENINKLYPKFKFLPTTKMIKLCQLFKNYKKKIV